MNGRLPRLCPTGFGPAARRPRAIMASGGDDTMTRGSFADEIPRMTSESLCARPTRHEAGNRLKSEDGASKRAVLTTTTGLGPYQLACMRSMTPWLRGSIVGRLTALALEAEVER